MKVTGSTRSIFWGGMPDHEIHSKLLNRIHGKILDNREGIIQYDSYFMEDAEVAVICYGYTARSVLFAIKALRQHRKKVGMLRLKTIWPFPDKLIASIDAKVKRIFVPEMNRGQVAGEVMKYARSEVISYTQTNGKIIHPDTIMRELEQYF